jgi:glycosyltransferase involved in cell wall biosynthesis
MKILIVWKNDYPWDVRVEKISRTLSSVGHDVHILARNTRRDPPRESAEGITIHRVSAATHRYLNLVATLPAFINPVWNRAIARVCERERIDLIVIRDLPLAMSGINIGRRLGIPTVLDMAEDVPAMWRDVIRARPYMVHNYLLKNPLLGRLLEKRCVHRIGHILVVVEEARDRLVALGIDRSKISIVSNTPQLSVFDDSSLGRRDSAPTRETVLFYHGYVNKTRGVETVVRAMPKLVEQHGEISFVVAGQGAELQRLEALSEKLGVGDHVQFLGWVAFDQIPGRIASSDLCIIPHLRTRHKDSTIPNKLFDYMALRKPVLVSDAKPLRRIVEENRCGVVFRSNDHDSLVASVNRLLDDPSLAIQFGRNGRKAVLDRYNWEHDSRVLRAVIDACAGSQEAGTGQSDQ